MNKETVEIEIEAPQVNWLPMQTCPRQPGRMYLLFTDMRCSEVGVFEEPGRGWVVGSREVRPLFWSPCPKPPDRIKTCERCIISVYSDAPALCEWCAAAAKAWAESSDE